MTATSHSWAAQVQATGPLPGPMVQFVPERAGHAHHHANALDKAFRYAGIGAAAVSLSPFVLSRLGFGQKEREELALKCCPITEKRSFSILSDGNGQPAYGIAGTVAAALERIPVAGGELSRGGIANAIAGGGLMVMGHYGGAALESLERRRGGSGRIGRFVRNASQVLGVVLTLPALLPGVGHGAAFLASTFGIDRVDWETLEANGPGASLAGLMGKPPGLCKSENKLTDGAKGAGAILLAQLCCAAPAVVAGLTAAFAPDRQQGVIR